MIVINILKLKAEVCRNLRGRDRHVPENIGPVIVSAQNSGAVIAAIHGKPHRRLLRTFVLISGVVPIDIHPYRTVRLHNSIGNGKLSQIKIFTQLILIILRYRLVVTPRKIHLFQGILNRILVSIIKRQELKLPFPWLGTIAVFFGIYRCGSYVIISVFCSYSDALRAKLRRIVVILPVYSKLYRPFLDIHDQAVLNQDQSVLVRCACRCSIIIQRSLNHIIGARFSVVVLIYRYFGYIPFPVCLFL